MYEAYYWLIKNIDDAIDLTRLNRNSARVPEQSENRSRTLKVIVLNPTTEMTERKDGFGDGMAVSMALWAGIWAILLQLALLLFFSTPPGHCQAARTYAASQVRMGIPLQHHSWEVRTKGGNAAILNREVQDNYLLTVKASIKGDTSEAWTKVSVQVLDMNDLRPLFSPTTYSVTIAESTPLRTSIAQVTATDADIGSNGEFYYFFKERMELFAVHPTSGVVSLSGKLDVDTQSRYDLEIQAVDRGMKLYGNNGVSSTAKLFVHVERINEHVPTLSIVTLAPVWTEKSPVVAVVTVEDLDEGVKGEIETVSIVAGDLLELFSIERTEMPSEELVDEEVTQKGSKEFVLRATEQFDWDSYPFGLNLSLQARDRGTPQKFSAVHTVHLRLSRPAPAEVTFQKDKYEVLLSEVAPPGTVVEAVKLQPEPDDAEYILTPSTDSGFFSINTMTGVISTARWLTQLTQEVFELEVLEVDSDLRVKVRIILEDANDNAPSFAQQSYEVFVNESVAVGTTVVVVTASDGDHGENGRESEVNVTVHLENVNDNKPLFEKVACVGVISRDFPVVQGKSPPKSFSCTETRVAQRLAEKLLKKAKASSKPKMDEGFIDLFSVNRQMPQFDKSFPTDITVREDVQVGQPQRSSWRLLTVYIADANDNAPQFLQDGGYQARIPENTPIGTEVIQVEATDKDQGLNGQLDREFVPFFILKVEARDRAERVAQQFSVTTLKIYLEDVNDCPPAFIPSVVSARALEDLPVGTVIAWLDTQDPDLGLGGQVRYSLANDYDGRFEVDKTSGAIRLTKELDFETQQFFNLTVRAKDKGRPVSLLSVSFVELEVVDVNENLYAPYFSNFAMNGSVKESVRIGTSVLQVSARDDDTGRDGEVQYSIRDGSGLGRFTIDEETGVIYTTDLLDRETQDSYWLTVYATDLGVVPQSAALQVYIQVEDVNDNAPLTSEPMYHATIPENSPKDQSIIQIQAQDPDAMATEPRLSFRISSGNPQNFFTINPRTGLITTTSRKLDREQQAEHVLEVTVSDGGPSPRHTTVWVVIQVLDVNDNKPTFPEKVYQVRLPERTRKQRGAPIYRVFAYDQDQGANAELSYSIIDGNEDGKFVIDAKTGVVSSPKKQFTAGTYDILTVKAVDNGRPQRWVTARLHIEWIRRPPASPVPLAFDEQLYNFTVMETDKVADIVGVVSAQQQGSASLWFDITGESLDALC
ncbi:hypothetical protein cypCar_00009522 [Cyprinus carpio]|nr:hypothetical protein cypCar_00009522 [Cyprinus carpio]